MKQVFVPFGKYLYAGVLAATSFSFATNASAQTEPRLGERVSIDLSPPETSDDPVEAEDKEEAAPLNSGPPERIDLLAEQQKQARITAEQALADADAAYGPRKPKPCPKSTDPSEIIVCAAPQDDSEFRVKSNAELGVRDNDGLPLAEDIPGIAGPGIFTGPPTVSGLCTPGSCPPPMPIMIDLEAIPEAPAGSDADLIAKGEKRLD